MNAKTYGQALFESLGGTDWGGLDKYARELFEKHSRTSILEFIRRVEEAVDDVDGLGIPFAIAPELQKVRDQACVGAVFRYIANEIKRTK